MYLETFTKTSKAGRVLVGLLYSLLEKEILSKSDLCNITKLAEDPVSFTEIFNKLITKAVPPDHARALEQHSCNDKEVCGATCHIKESGESAPTIMAMTCKQEGAE